MWFKQYFDGTFVRSKWKAVEQNLKVGDYCLKTWSRKLGPVRYQICLVVEVLPDAEGNVRTVIVASRLSSSLTGARPV